MLPIEIDVGGTAFNLGLQSQSVLIDCDRVTLEIDRLEFPEQTWSSWVPADVWEWGTNDSGYGTNIVYQFQTASKTASAIVPFVAVLSQPATR
jgi:hypothetical protein